MLKLESSIFVMSFFSFYNFSGNYRDFELLLLTLSAIGKN